MSVGTPNVIVLEDDPDLRRVLKAGLEEEGFGVRATSTGHEAIGVAEDAPPDLLVIDVGLPDSDGRDVCQALRARGIPAPVIFLTARDAVTDRISGFGVGGDDYMTKPFAFAELVARLRALLRRTSRAAESVGTLRIDPVRHELQVGDGSVRLTPTEFRLLGALAARPGEVVRRSELLAAGWPEGAIVHDNTLDVFIGKLRRKMAGLGSEAAIATVHGVGYRLE